MAIFSVRAINILMQGNWNVSTHVDGLGSQRRPSFDHGWFLNEHVLIWLLPWDQHLSLIICMMENSCVGQGNFIIDSMHQQNASVLGEQLASC